MKNLPIELAALAIRTQAVIEVLELLTTATSTDREAGRRALLLAFLLKPELIGTQTDLAARMKLSRARVSQMINKMRRGIGGKYGESVRGELTAFNKR